jgi:hypothetical protein
MKMATDRTTWIARHALISGRWDHGLSRREVLVVTGVLAGLTTYLAGLLFLLT